MDCKQLCVCSIHIPTIIGLFTPPVALGTSVEVLAIPVPIHLPLRATVFAVSLPLPATPVLVTPTLLVGPKSLTPTSVPVSLTNAVIVHLSLPVPAKPVSVPLPLQIALAYNIS